MKHLRHFVIVVFMLLMAPAWAYDFEVDGICYNITGISEVEVTGRSGYYSGEISIPESVSYNGALYSVTGIGSYAFGNCGSLTTITIPNTVIRIGQSAFRECTSLTSITIPNSVESIGDYAFGYCPGLTSLTVANVNPTYDSRSNCNAIIETETNTLLFGCMNTIIPNSVTSIGYTAFEGCTSLTAIDIPNSVTRIERGAFWGCSGLTSVNIPESIEYIESAAFAYCSGLNTITVDIGNSFFDSRENCNAIIYSESNILLRGCKSTVIPNSVTGIGTAAFQGCTTMTSITIPNSVKSIGMEAFKSCAKLRTINLPNSITSIGGYAFMFCDELSSIVIPNSVTDIGSGAFLQCYSLTSVTIPNSVKWLGMGAFAYCRGLRTVSLPNTITSIASGDCSEHGMFYGCSNLVSINIPNTVKSIGDFAFRSCSSLTTITIPNSVNHVGKNAFYNSGIYNNESNWDQDVLYEDGCLLATKQTINPNYVIKPGTRVIADNAFESRTGLNSVTIPGSVTKIGESAFSGCTSLTAINVPMSVTSIGKNAFTNSGLYNDTNNWDQGVFYVDNCLIDASQGSENNFEIKNDTWLIADYAFKDRTELTSVSFPNSLLRICDGAFEGCTGIINLNIPNSVTSIGDGAFYKCSGLTSLTISVSLTSIGKDTFYNCSGLTSIKIPNTVIYIGENAFYGCYRLTELSIPNSVENIGDRAFSQCNGLRTIIIGNSVNSIGLGAFACGSFGYHNLNSVIIKATTPPIIGDWSFPEVVDHLYVPCGCQETYQNNIQWSSIFTSILDAFPYTLLISSSDENLGHASIIQQPDCESNIAIVKAEAQTGHPFLGWMSNGNVLSTANPYTFTVEDDTELIAMFYGTGVEEERTNIITISPNPSNDRVRIECEGMHQVELYTMEGKQLALCKPSSNIYEMDLSIFNSGIYIIRIKMENGQYVNKKLIIE